MATNTNETNDEGAESISSNLVSHEESKLMIDIPNDNNIMEPSTPEITSTLTPTSTKQVEEPSSSIQKREKFVSFLSAVEITPTQIEEDPSQVDEDETMDDCQEVKSAASTAANPAKITQTAMEPIASTPTISPARTQHSGRRSLSLRLVEECDSHSNDNNNNSKNSSSNNNTNAALASSFRKLGSLRRFRSLSLGGLVPPLIEENDLGNNTGDISGSNNGEASVERGVINVSWYEGTTSVEMREHVHQTVLRTLKRGEGTVLEDVRLLDESVVPMEEVILSPFLPDGSRFLLKFKTITPRPPPAQHPNPPRNTNHLYISRPPDSPSAEPTPYHSSENSNVATFHSQLQLLNAVTALLQSNGTRRAPTQGHHDWNGRENGHRNIKIPDLPILPSMETVPKEFKDHHPLLSTGRDEASGLDTAVSGAREDSTVIQNGSVEDNEKALSHSIGNENSSSASTDQLIEQQLRQLNELFLLRNGANGNQHNLTPNEPTPNELDPSDEVTFSYYKSQEKKQVIFVISNYLLLFMSLIALSAEIQSRLPQWMTWVQSNYDSVQNCATDRDALFECVSNGNFSGLVASFMLWATQSASAKRIFLFGFDTPKKLWTVVYEAGVTAVCWGLSYLFIRRGLNPNTREKFIQKYWKDAVYGSLAGFNAAFMKAVLKNLVPQDVALQAIETRQLRIFNWLGMLMSDE